MDIDMDLIKKEGERWDAATRERIAAMKSRDIKRWAKNEVVNLVMDIPLMVEERNQPEVHDHYNPRREMFMDEIEFQVDRVINFLSR